MLLSTQEFDQLAVPAELSSPQYPKLEISSEKLYEWSDNAKERLSPTDTGRSQRRQAKTRKVAVRSEMPGACGEREGGLLSGIKAARNHDKIFHEAR